MAQEPFKSEVDRKEVTCTCRCWRSSNNGNHSGCWVKVARTIERFFPHCICWNSNGCVGPNPLWGGTNQRPAVCPSTNTHIHSHVSACTHPFYHLATWAQKSGGLSCNSQSLSFQSRAKQKQRDTLTWNPLDNHTIPGGPIHKNPPWRCKLAKA